MASLVVTQSFVMLGLTWKFVALIDGKDIFLARGPHLQRISFPEQVLYLVPQDGAEDFFGMGKIPPGLERRRACDLWPEGIPEEIRSESFDSLLR